MKTAADKKLIMGGILTCVRTKVNVTLQLIHAEEIHDAKSKSKNFLYLHSCLLESFSFIAKVI